MAVVVLGAGAVGGLYGGMLAKAGEDVHWLLNSDRDHVAKHGLRVDSPLGDFVIEKPQVVAAANQLPRCQLLLVGLKTTQSAVLFETLKDIAHPGLTVLLLQNGLGLEEEVAEQFPQVKIIGGLCFVCSHKAGPGHITHLDYGAIRLGSFRDSDRETCSDWSGKLRAAGIPVQPADDLLRARWEKLVWNMPYNGLSVILNQSTGPIMSDSTSREMIHSLMLEVIQVARAAGHDLSDGLADLMLKNTENMKDYQPSMLLDYRHQKPLELEYIYRNPLKVAKATGVSTPGVDRLLQQLEATEAEYLVR